MLGEEVAKEVINYLGYGVFESEISDMKPAVKSGLQNILGKYKVIESPKKPEESNSEIKENYDVEKDYVNEYIENNHDNYEQNEDEKSDFDLIHEKSVEKELYRKDERKCKETTKRYYDTIYI